MCCSYNCIFIQHQVFCGLRAGHGVYESGSLGSYARTTVLSTDKGKFMIVVNATITASADTIAALQPAIAAMETASRAEAGCHDYTFSVELNNPDVLRITEKWATMDDLQAHFGMPHMADFQAAMAAHPPQGVEAKFYEVTEVAPPM